MKIPEDLVEIILAAFRDGVLMASRGKRRYGLAKPLDYTEEVLRTKLGSHIYSDAVMKLVRTTIDNKYDSIIMEKYRNNEANDRYDRRMDLETRQPYGTKFKKK